MKDHGPHQFRGPCKHSRILAEFVASSFSGQEKQSGSIFGIAYTCHRMNIQNHFSDFVLVACTRELRAAVGLVSMKTSSYRSLRFGDIRVVVRGEDFRYQKRAKEEKEMGRKRF